MTFAHRALMLLCLIALPAHAALVKDAQAIKLRPSTEKVAFVPVARDAPVVDGKLDDAAWENAVTLDGWGQFPGGGSSEIDSTVRVVTHGEFLYVAWSMTGTKNLPLKQPRAGRIDDYGGAVLEMFFDPTGDRKTRIQIVANPIGLRYDGFNTDPKWNGTWKSAGIVQDDAWTLEVAIPAADLKVSMGDRPGWRANFGITYAEDGAEIMHSWTSRWSDPSTDYGTLYFGSREQYEQSLQPRLSLFMDRIVYDLRDSTAVVLARLYDAGASPDALSLNVTVARDGQAVAQQTIAKLPDTDVDLTLDLAALPAGDYQLNVEVIGNGKAIAAATQAFSRKDRGIYPAIVTEGRIPVRVHAQPDLAGVAWPITTGVPFAQGTLNSPANVRLLDPHGREVPCQTSVRATWHRGGSVQWLGLDFVPTLSDSEQVYTLEFGPKVKAAASAPSLKVDQTDSLISVDTGPMQFTVNRRQFALISSASIDGKAIITPDLAGGGLLLVDHEGNRYVSAHDRDVDVVVEETGPVRTTIRATGWYVKEGSAGSRTSVELPTDRLCLFTVRLSAFAGSPIIKGAASTTLTFDSTKVRISELSIGLPIGRGADVKVGDVALADQGYLLQDRWDRAVDASGTEHARSEGWVTATSDRGNVMVAVRRFWQLFPKEIGYANGVLTFHPWPAHGRKAFDDAEATRMENIYKLGWAHEGKELDLRLPDVYRKALDADQAANATQQSPYYEAMSFSNGQGLTIHNDFLIALQPATSKKAAGINGGTLAKLANADPHAMPDPAYTCDTGALGPILAADPDFAPLEETIRRGFVHLTTRTQPNNEYGMFILGNIHTYWRYHEKPMRAGVHRVWMNGHYQIARLPFVQYARTGNPVWMGWGRDHANTLRDIAMVNYVSDERRFPYHTLGSMYHCKGFAPWAGDGGPSAHPVTVDFLVYDYLIHGNGRSRDVLNNWIEGIMKMSPGGNGTREGINPMSEMLAVYSLTWNAGFIELIDRYRAAIYSRPLTSQGWWDYNSLLFPRDYLLTGSPATLAAYREAAAGRNQSYGGMSIYHGLLATFDNDTSMLESWSARLHQNALSVLNRPGAYGDGMTEIMWMGFSYGAIKYPYLLRAMKTAGLGIKRPTMTQPAPIVLHKNQTLLAVRETTDQVIAVTIASRQAPAGEISARVLRADGVEVAQGTRPAVPNDQKNLPLTLTIPADGQASQYLIVIQHAQSYDNVLWPVTTLEHEVAIVPAGERVTIGANEEGIRLFIAPGRAMTLRIGSNSKTAMGMELLDGTDKVLATASSSRFLGDGQTVTIPSGTPGAAEPLSLYFSAEATLIAETDRPLIVGLTAKSLFTPSVQLPSAAPSDAK